MVQHRHKVVLYTAAVCNLNCHYCAIDKNPALIEIDRMLEESFRGDYYINFMKEIFPDPNQLTTLETWGGEPFIGMHRIYHIIEDMIEWYPNFKEFFSSTNLTHPKFHEEFYGLLDVFGKYPDRKFTVKLQLSSDGPEYITDASRGVGVAKSIDVSLKKLFSEINTHTPPNVDLMMHFKPTLDEHSFKQLISKERIIEYFQYFENYFCLFEELVHIDNAHIFPTIPNMASPGKYTTKDGKLFAELCRLCREIELENKTEKYFKHYPYITPFAANNAVDNIMEIPCAGFTCGSCREIVGLLPNKMISGCHGAFVDLLADYKNKFVPTVYQNKMIDAGIFTRDSYNFFCFPQEKLSTREEQMENYYLQKTTARISTAEALIRVLALTGQIDKQFAEHDMALKAADYIYKNISNCLKDNLATNGTITMPYIGILRLLLNGAYDIITSN